MFITEKVKFANNSISLSPSSFLIFLPFAGLTSFQIRCSLSRKEHWKLLSSLKTTVEGLVSTNNPNVWSRYGGLQRLHKDMNNILSNGLKNEQVKICLIVFAIIIIAQRFLITSHTIWRNKVTFCVGNSLGFFWNFWLTRCEFRCVSTLSRCSLSYIVGVVGNIFTCCLCDTGVLQAKRLLAICVVCPLHQPTSRFACWTGMFKLTDQTLFQWMD